MIEIFDFCGLEYGEVGSQTLVVDSEGTTITSLRDSTVNCKTTVGALNQVIKRFTMGDREGTLFCSLEGEFIAEGECEDDVAAFNAAVFALQKEEFQECARTTMTTTVTTTASTTPTTTPTTTPVQGKFSCFTYAKQNYLVVNGDDTVCEQQATVVDEVMDACELELHGYMLVF